MPLGKSKKLFVVMCAMLMTVMIFQNVSASPNDSSIQVDVFEDHLGNEHKVWREDMNGTYQIAYSNDIEGDNGIGIGGLIISNVSGSVSYPQVAVDEASHLIYILFAIDTGTSYDLSYFVSQDYYNWTGPLFIEAIPYSIGNPTLDMSVDESTLIITWRQGGYLSFPSDIDNDLILDYKDDEPFTFNLEGADDFSYDALSIDKELGVVVAIDYEGDDVTEPIITEGFPPEAPDGGIGIYRNISTSSNQSFSAVIKIIYDPYELPAGITEKYLRMYNWNGEYWEICYDYHNPDIEDTGIDRENNIVWGITPHFSSFALSDALLEDKDEGVGDGLSDAEERNEDGAPFAPINWFADNDPGKELFFDDSNPEQTVHFNIPDYTATMEYVIDAKFVVEGFSRPDLSSIYPSSSLFDDSYYPYDIEPADYDNDGDIDIIVLTGSQMLFYENLGAGQISNPIQISAETGSQLETGDFNDDGLIDLLVGGVSTSGGQIKRYLNTGAGFETPLVMNMPSYGIAVLDINHDGRDDFIATKDDGFSIQLCLSNFIFAQYDYITLGSGTAVKEISVADFNSDGDDDLLLVSSLYGSKSIFFIDVRNEGEQDTEWINPPIEISTSRFYDISVSDYNDDGFIDFCGNNIDKELILYKNNGEFDFEIAETWTYSHFVEDHKFVDFDKDSDSDLILIQDDSFVLSENNGHGEFQIATSYSTDVNPKRLTLLDITEDDDFDILVYHEGVTDSINLFEHAGIPTFNVSFDIGNDGITDWERKDTGAFSLTTPQFVTEFNEFFTRSESVNNALNIPLKISTDKSAEIDFEYVSILVGTYDTDPRSLDTDEDGINDGLEFNINLNRGETLDALEYNGYLNSEITAVMDAANAFENSIQVTYETEDISEAKIAYGDGFVYLAYVRENSNEIVFKTSSNNGASWSEPEVVVAADYDIGHIDFAADGSYLGIIWEEYSDGDLYPFLNVKYSENAGLNWSVTYEVGRASVPSIDIQQNEIYIAYRAYQPWPDPQEPGYLSVMRMIWTDDGDLDYYQFRHPSSGGALHHGIPDISVSGGFIHLVITDLHSSSIYYWVSSDLGSSWSSPELVANYYGSTDVDQVSLDSNDERVVLAWSTFTNDKRRICGKYASAPDWSWSNVMKISADSHPVDSENPVTLIDSNNNWYIFWNDLDNQILHSVLDGNIDYVVEKGWTQTYDVVKPQITLGDNDELFFVWNDVSDLNNNIHASLQKGMTVIELPIQAKDSLQYIKDCSLKINRAASFIESFEDYPEDFSHWTDRPYTDFTWDEANERLNFHLDTRDDHSESFTKTLRSPLNKNSPNWEISTSTSLTGSAGIANGFPLLISEERNPIRNSITFGASGSHHLIYAYYYDSTGTGTQLFQYDVSYSKEYVLKARYVNGHLSTRIMDKNMNILDSGQIAISDADFEMNYIGIQSLSTTHPGENWIEGWVDNITFNYLQPSNLYFDVGGDSDYILLENKEEIILDVSSEINQFVSINKKTEGVYRVPVVIKSDVLDQRVGLTLLSGVSEIITTNPVYSDTDKDGLGDGAEMNMAGHSGNVISSLNLGEVESDTPILNLEMTAQSVPTISIPSDIPTLNFVTNAKMDVEWEPTYSQMSEGTVSGRHHDIATDSFGNVHVVWSENNNILYRRCEQGGWTPIENVATGDSPKIAIDARDSLHIVWFDSGIHYKLWDGTSWSSSEIVNVNSLSASPDIAIGLDDSIHIIWAVLGIYEDIYYTTKELGVWNSTILIGQTGHYSNFQNDLVDIGIDSDGKPHVIWSQATDHLYPLYKVLYTTYENEAWTSYYEITNGPDYDTSKARIVIDSNDDIHVVWVEDRAINYRGQENAIWNTEIQLGEGDYPSVSTDSNDEIIVTWISDSGGILKTYNRVDWSAERQITEPLPLDSGLSTVVDDTEPGLMHVIGGMDWLFYKSFNTESKLTLDAGYDGDIQFEIDTENNGASGTTIDLSNEINEYLVYYKEIVDGFVDVPLGFVTRNYGNVTLSNIQISYDVIITDPTSEYSDGDSLSDGEEIIGWTVSVDYNGDGDTEDLNEEYLVISNPACADSDFDGIPDDIEKNEESDPTVFDTDLDGLSDYEELDFGDDGVITIPNDIDTDDDSVNDLVDAFPTNPMGTTDTDIDGFPDEVLLVPGWSGVILSEDSDDDNDGVSDISDPFPKNPTGSIDTDSDGKPNSLLKEPWWFKGVPLKEDWDDDGDDIPDYGLNDTGHNNKVRDGIGPYTNETHFAGDHDGEYDWGEYDEFPLDSTEWLDTDDDGIGNNADEDSDNDGDPDPIDESDPQLGEDEHPRDPKAGTNTDGDSEDDNSDEDDDTPDSGPYAGNGDGVRDELDDFRSNPTGILDTDGDGLTDELFMSAPDWYTQAGGFELEVDDDDDGDGVDDIDEPGGDSHLSYYSCDSNGVHKLDRFGNDLPFSKDPTESVDTDGDHIGDNADDDDDGDNVNDDLDVFPLDPAASVDTDQDGKPDELHEGYTTSDTSLEIDNDDDGDGLLDEYETNTGSYASKTNTGTDPLDFDTDDDGLADGIEVNGWWIDIELNNEKYIQTEYEDPSLNDLHYWVNSDPFNEFSDCDALNDYWEYKYGTDPWFDDSDGDGLNDGDELIDAFGGGWLPKGADWDDDGTPNGPTDYDSIGDGQSDKDGYVITRPLTRGDDYPFPDEDADKDYDRDGLTNAHEWDTNFNTDPTGEVYRTSYLHPDSDEDGLWDGGHVHFYPQYKNVDYRGGTRRVLVKVSKQCSPETYRGENFIGTIVNDGSAADNLINIGQGETDPLNQDMDDDGFLDGPDIDPIEDIEVTIRIKEILARDPLDKYKLNPEADFYMWISCDKITSTSWGGTSIESSEIKVTFASNTNHITSTKDVTFNVPDNLAWHTFTMHLFDSDDSDVNSLLQSLKSDDETCDISKSASGNGGIELFYSITEARLMSGGDYLGDIDGLGHADGTADGSQNTESLDCEIWFDVLQTDYDDDYMTYYQEVDLYNTDATWWDSDGDMLSDREALFMDDTDGDGQPDFDPNRDSDYVFGDFDGDGLNNRWEINFPITVAVGTDPTKEDTDGDDLRDDRDKNPITYTNRYALVVGITEFDWWQDWMWPDLTGHENAPQSMRNDLQSMGFEVEDRIGHVTESEFLEAIDIMQSKWISSDDIVVVYLSTHGAGHAEGYASAFSNGLVYASKSYLPKLKGFGKALDFIWLHTCFSSYFIWDGSYEYLQQNSAGDLILFSSDGVGYTTGESVFGEAILHDDDSVEQSIDDIRAEWFWVDTDGDGILDPGEWSQWHSDYRIEDGYTGDLYID